MIALKDVPLRDRQIARRTAWGMGLTEAGLSLTAAVSVVVLTAMLFSQSLRREYLTTTPTNSGRGLAVGPDGDGGLTVVSVRQHSRPRAIGFTSNRPR